MANDLISLGDYHGTMIHARPSDQYINATAMCKATGKEWSGYWRNEQTQEFINALASSLQICRDDLIVSRPGPMSNGGGTWVHRRAAIHLAQWCSSDFAVWVTGRIEELLLTGSTSVHREYSEATIAEHVGEKVSRQLVGMEQRINVRMDNQDRKIEAVCKEVQKVSNSIAGKREDFSPDTGRIVAEVVKQFPFFGKCPICGENDVGHLHHWLGKGGRDPKYCLPLCVACHDLVTENYDLHETSEWRDAFNRFQKRLQAALKDRTKARRRSDRSRSRQACQGQRRLFQ